MKPDSVGCGSLGPASSHGGPVGPTAKLHEAKMADHVAGQASSHQAHLGRLGLDSSGNKTGGYSDPDEDK